MKEKVVSSDTYGRVTNPKGNDVQYVPDTQDLLKGLNKPICNHMNMFHKQGFLICTEDKDLVM